MRHFAIVAAAVVSFSASAFAQTQDFSDVEIRVERLAPGVAVLFGAGGNIALSYGTDGNVIIDDQFAPLTPKILAAIHTLDPDPVRLVINTHWHGDHTGGNANLGRAGAVIIAQENVRERLASEQHLRGKAVAASPPEALPVITYEDGVTVHLNDDDLRVMHVKNAHTDGDSIIRWTKADVLHMGDTFFNKVRLPFIDRGSGGSLDGTIAAANVGLQLAGPNTKIIPGHGPMGTRADLLAYRDMLVDLRDKISVAVSAGQTLEQVKASKPTAAYPITEGVDEFIETAYAEMKAR